VEDLAPNGVGKQDVRVLIGIMAVLEGILMAQQMPDFIAEALRSRFVMVGLLGEAATERDLRQAINDLNHRLRYVKGEYPQPPVPIPVPDL
jgi:hypothetical protein